MSEAPRCPQPTGQVDLWVWSVQHLCMNQSISFGSEFSPTKFMTLKLPRFNVCSSTFYDLEGTEPVLKYRRLLFCFVYLWITYPTHSIYIPVVHTVHVCSVLLVKVIVILYDRCFIIGTGTGRLCEDCSHNLLVKMG